MTPMTAKQPSAARAAGLKYARLNRMARVTVQNLTPWSAGLVVSAGEYITNVSLAYQALNSGTTAGTQGPTQYGQFTDAGGVTWLFVPTQAFVRIPNPATPA
ncbi:MAG TPA: hypothetical protein VMV19_18215 [Xanthobacteraceae bacterium]|nr:hypothetical protein [Xanthobacteraceae bacterium]